MDLYTNQGWEFHDCTHRPAKHYVLEKFRFFCYLCGWHYLHNYLHKLLSSQLLCIRSCYVVELCITNLCGLLLLNFFFIAQMSCLITVRPSSPFGKSNKTFHVWNRIASSEFITGVILWGPFFFHVQSWHLSWPLFVFTKTGLATSASCRAGLVHEIHPARVSRNIGGVSALALTRNTVQNTQNKSIFLSVCPQNRSISSMPITLCVCWSWSSLSAGAKRWGWAAPGCSYQLPRYTPHNRMCVDADLCVFVFRLCKYVHSPVFVTQERREELG